ncbi:MAG: L-seryl-tRNA(Sec) selenium transferase [Eggerthellaceae bacterium]|nr:L-seryl-tRNA(Sec) selenium transferase [Eggerthellaceae bacterium]
MSDNASQELLRQMPSIDRVLTEPVISRLGALVPHDILTGEARNVVSQVRSSVLQGKTPDVSAESIAETVAKRCMRLMTPSLKRVINASGVIIHTNLGRSVLAPAAQDAVKSVICGYSTLEYSVPNMARGSRHAHCESLIRTLTGAEAAIAVNNNAAAVMMVLSEFAAERQVVVSRGELVEIGGAFRMPDVMAQSHATMVEVGTTNKTHASDYERVINDQTALLMKAHPSNYRLEGFTKSVSLAEMRQIADAFNSEHPDCSPILVYEDQGAGAFVHMDSFGRYSEPTVAESMRQGADLVSFSGDKLLGGPQAGIIVGRKELIDRLKANPLARAMRLDKMTLAALEATLRLYLDPAEAVRQIPTLRMLTEPADGIEQRAQKMLDIIAQRVGEDDAYLQIVPEVARAGGGSLPMCDIETYAVEVEFIRGDAQSCEEFLIQERPVPIIGRIRQDVLLLDARTVIDESEMNTIAQGLGAYFRKLPKE